eukprot:jgi/Botrbrau1/22215/Bobra.168_1s0046.1
MYGGQDYGATQFGGAGFIASPPNDAAGGTQSLKGNKSMKAQTLRALTVKQLVQATQNASADDTIRIDNEEITNVTIVGKIVGVQDTSTSVDFQVNDGTGIVEVKHWRDAEDEANLGRADWQPGVYIRVHGHIRYFDGKRSIVGFNIRVIQDFNEVTYHFLQCIFQHADLARRNGGAAPSGALGGGGGMAQPQLGGAAASAAGGPTRGAPADVMELLEISETGGQSDLHIQQIISKLSHKYNEKQVRQAVEYLNDEGFIYTSTSDEHFKLARAE